MGKVRIFYMVVAMQYKERVRAIVALFVLGLHVYVSLVYFCVF